VVSFAREPNQSFEFFRFTCLYSVFNSGFERQIGKRGNRHGSRRETRSLCIFGGVRWSRRFIFVWPSLDKYVQLHQTLIAERVDFLLDIFFRFLDALPLFLWILRWKC
jgi:hypothetical protein